jgi:Flp pilus assembly protein TadG
MAVEVVLLAPVLVAVLLLVVGFGRFVDRQGDVEAAAREAARAASYERDYSSAAGAAQQAAARTLPDGVACGAPDLGESDFRAGGMVRVQISCSVDLSDLGFVGFPGSVSLTGRSSAPLDEYRRTS